MNDLLLDGFLMAGTSAMSHFFLAMFSRASLWWAPARGIPVSGKRKQYAEIYNREALTQLDLRDAWAQQEFEKD